MREERTTPARATFAAVALCACALLMLLQAWPGARAHAAKAGGGPKSRPWTGPPIDTSNADRCDFLDPAVCLQPWPNDYFTVADPSTDTGRRLNLNQQSMPANKAGVHIDPTDYNRAD